MLVASLLSGGGAASVAVPAPAQAWVWPVTGPIIRGFDPPDSPYGSGHRGVDIAVALGTPVLAVAAGKITFAGPVGGRLFLTIDHGGGLDSTYSWLSSLVARKGQTVAPGQVIARSGTGHPGSIVPHLHFGVRLDGTYLDPLDYLPALDVSSLIRLAPLAA